MGVNFLEHRLNLDDTHFHNSSTNQSGINADPYKVSNAENLQQVSFGIALPIHERVVIGASGVAPTNSFARIHAFSGQESQYLTYSDRSLRPEVYSAVGVKLPYNISLGAGAFYSVRARGLTELSISQTAADSRLYMQLDPVVVPYGGILWSYDFNETDKLLIGSYYRSKQAGQTNLTIDVTFNLNVASIPFTANSGLIAYFDPAVFSNGAAYKTDKYSLFVQVDKIYWSKYEAPIINLAGKDLDALTGGAKEQANIRLKDIYAYHFGAEITNLAKFKDLTLSPRVGYERHGSASIKPVQSVVVIDTAKTVYNLGFGLNLGNLLKYKSEINSNLKYVHLEEENFKSYAGRGVQTASIGGHIWSWMVGVTLEI